MLSMISSLTFVKPLCCRKSTPPCEAISRRNWRRCWLCSKWPWWRPRFMRPGTARATGASTLMAIVLEETEIWRHAGDQRRLAAYCASFGRYFIFSILGLLRRLGKLYAQCGRPAPLSAMHFTSPIMRRANSKSIALPGPCRRLMQTGWNGADQGRPSPSPCIAHHQGDGFG